MQGNFPKIDTNRPVILHGLPITPAHLLEQLAGESFCVSFADPRQLERAIALQDPRGMLMLDNGAFSHWRAGRGQIDRDAFFAWANQAQARCPVAVAVVPDVIQGDEAQNWREAELALELSAHPDRLMFVWHMNDSLEQLERAARTFGYLAIGSCAEYDVQRRRAAYLERLEQAHQVVDQVAGELGRRPWVHLMRGTAVVVGAMWANSSDSTNVARNHCRTKGEPEHVQRFADRLADQVDGQLARNACSQALGGLYPNERFMHLVDTGAITLPGERARDREPLQIAA